MSAATQPSQSIDVASDLNLATVGDYFALLKPRVMSLVLFTGVAGLVLAPGSIHIATALTALLAIAVGAGASGALNMAYDADIDRLMTFMEKIWRRLIDMVQGLQKDADRKG